MFKKDPQVRALANLKSSERRKLVEFVYTTYGLTKERVPPEVEKQLVPSVIKKTTFKSPLGISGTIYTDADQTPVWFCTKDSEIMPTIFTLWKTPFLVPVIATHPHVIGILVGGADLMLPGTLPPFDPRLTKGKLVGIVDSDNPTVIKAIGTTKLNLTQFDRVIGRTGVAVEVIHVFGDELCKMTQVDVPIPTDILNMVLPEREVEEKEENQEEEIPETTEENARETQNISDEEKNSESHGSLPETEEKRPEAEEKLLEAEERAPEVESNSPEQMETLAEMVSELAVEDVDKFFKRALLQSIVVDQVKPPLTASSLMSSHVLKNFPAIDPAMVSMKKTSWKKTAKFLKAMEKEKLVQTKGKGDDVTVVAFAGPEVDQVKDFVPYRVKSANNGKTLSKEQLKPNQLQGLIFFKPMAVTKPFFKKVSSPYDVFYEQPEIRDLLSSYVKSNNLIDKKTPKMVSLDETLTAIIYAKMKQSAERSSTIGRDKILHEFLNGFTQYYQVVNPAKTQTELEAPPISRGTIPHLSVITEVKIGRKVVTRVCGIFDIFYIRPSELAKVLKVKCQGSATIHENVQNPSEMEVMVQGSHERIVVDTLTKSYGVNRNWIDTINNVQKKKKK